MTKFSIQTDEQIKVWQRVGLVVEADSEEHLNEIMNDPIKFQEAMSKGKIEYNGSVDPYWETEDHNDWDHESFNINHTYEENQNA